jgi:hypothetical protein
LLFDDGKQHFYPSRKWNPANLWWENYIAMPSLVRREALPAGGLDPSVDLYDDWHLWLDVASRGWSVRRVDGDLFTALVREAGRTRQFQRDPIVTALTIARLRRSHAGVVGAGDPIAVVIPACGSEDLTIRCLDHLSRFSGVPLVVYYVDNGSGDRTVQAVRESGAAMELELHVLQNRHNAGFTDAVNRGMRAAGNRHVLVLNNDCFVGPNCVERLWWAVERQPRCAASGPLSGDWGAHSLRHHGSVERVGADPSILSHLHDPVTSARLLDQRERYESVGMLAFF